MHKSSVSLLFFVSIHYASIAAAEKIQGEVVHAEGAAIEMSVASDLLPVVGDKLEIYVEVPGVGKAQVGVASVSKVDGGRIFANVSDASGRVMKGQSVTIDSPKPVRPASPKSPLLIGRTATDAKKQIEALGFTVKIKIGVDAPAGVKPFTVYAQSPEADSELASGQPVIITLYGDSKSSANNPSIPTSTQAPAKDPIQLRPVRSKLTRPTDESRRITKFVAKLMEDTHISGHALDDEISERVLEEMLRGLDPRKLYFHAADYAEFMRDRHGLDDQLKHGDTSFAFTIFNRFLQRASEAIEIANELIDVRHDFTIEEEITSKYESLSYPRDAEQARERWRKQIKYDLLNQTAAGTGMKEARVNLHARYDSFLNRMSQTQDDELLEMTLTYLAHSYDPGSSYYSPRSWENQVISFKSQMVGIGASLRFIDGNLRVAKLVPGSPSHKDGRLKAGDRITAVGQGENGEFVDIQGMSLADVVNLIRGKSGTVVRLQVVPKEQREAQEYRITRRKFDLAKAASTILSGDKLPNGRQATIGFIHLPSFYTDWNAVGGEMANSATRDVRKILSGFRSNGVDLVIVDLRTNYGGALREAIDLTGLFIDQGNVLQVKSRNDQVSNYGDTDKGMAWDKPVVILTSAYTASGAELMAGALQDYERALLVGDASTQGSGIVHTVVDIGKKSFKIENPPNLGRLSVAHQRFYRPSGDSTQLQGVLADVVLPSLTGAINDGGEEQKRYALPFDRIAATAFSKTDFGISDELTTSLKKQSAARIASSEYFQDLAKTIRRYRERDAKQSVSLHRQTYLASRPAASDGSERTLDDIPDVKANGFLDEALHIALDYLAHQQFAQAEQDYKKKRYSDAVRKYKETVATDPRFISGHYKLAWLLATGKQRDGKLAVTHAERAVKLDNTDKWIYPLALAIAHAEAGNFDAAQEHLSNALDKAPATSRASYGYLQRRFRNRQSYPR